MKEAEQSSEETKVKPLSPVDFHRHSSMRMTHFADIPAGTPVEHVLQPEFWAHHTKMVRIRHHIEADWKDGSRLMVLRVVGVGLNDVKVKVLQNYEFEAKQESINDSYSVEWKGPNVHKWSIIRKSDSAYVKDGFDSKEDAYEYLNKDILKVAA